MPALQIGHILVCPDLNRTAFLSAFVLTCHFLEALGSFCLENQTQPVNSNDKFADVRNVRKRCKDDRCCSSKCTTLRGRGGAARGRHRASARVCVCAHTHSQPCPAAAGRPEGRGRVGPQAVPIGDPWRPKAPPRRQGRPRMPPYAGFIDLPAGRLQGCLGPAPPD